MVVTGRAGFSHGAPWPSAHQCHSLGTVREHVRSYVMPVLFTGRDKEESRDKRCAHSCHGSFRAPLAALHWFLLTGLRFGHCI